MPPAMDEESVTERTGLLYHSTNNHNHNHNHNHQEDEDEDEHTNQSTPSTFTKEEEEDEENPAEHTTSTSSTSGEKLKYNAYTTIDWLHCLAQDSRRSRSLRSRPGLRGVLVKNWDECEGWVAVVLIGAITAVVAWVVDVAVVTVGDWKVGYCSSSHDGGLGKEGGNGRGRGRWWMGKEKCGEEDWRIWSEGYWGSWIVYVAVAVMFGVVSSGLTMLTKTNLPAVEGEEKSGEEGSDGRGNGKEDGKGKGKVMYMAAGSGIPEIKTILSGFVIPSLLTPHVLLIKALGAIFAVSTGMCLGKEGPFVHISTCVGHIIGTSRFFPKYNSNGRKLRELLSASCAAGLSVAFGAPIGGVLFSYEEISTYFPRKVLWRAFLCSLFAAVVLKGLNPMGTGKLVLFETGYGTDYLPIHYVFFVLLGVAGGIFGGVFCKLNFLWSRWFRGFGIIKRNPVFEVVIVVVVTGVLQFPNLVTREMGDVAIRMLLVDCEGESRKTEWVCKNEGDGEDVNWGYVGWLMYGTVTKLVLTIITFGCKVPSGVIIPALTAGALFGRLLGQLITSISPGIFAMVGSAAFLAGVSRMTISLAVIMFELTGSLSYTVPHMISILVAKWVADSISSEGVYDLAQTVLGHPFLDPDTAIQLARKRKMLVEVLIPPKGTMEEITVDVPKSNLVAASLLRTKLSQLHARGLMDAGLVLVQRHPDPSGVPILQGYISQSDLEFGMEKFLPYNRPIAIAGPSEEPEYKIRVLEHVVHGRDDEAEEEAKEIDFTPFVDRTPLTICATAPLEYAVEMFSKLGLRYLNVVEEGSGALIGVIIKKRLVAFLEGLKEE